MEDSKKTKPQLINELNTLRQHIKKLEQMRAVSREDRLKLALIDRIPFTMWACNSNFEIVLWTGKCERNYQYRKEDAIGKNYLTLFVDEPEREQSEIDCIKIIDEDYVQNNFLAWDKAKDGTRRTMLTNCFRILDEDNKEWLQAEVALEISDLALSDKEHRNLRELGIARQTERRRALELKRTNTLYLLQEVYAKKSIQVDKKLVDTNKWRSDIERAQDSATADKLAKDDLEDIYVTRSTIQFRNREFSDKIIKAKNIDELELIEKEVREFEEE